MRRTASLSLLLIAGCGTPASLNAVDAETGRSIELFQVPLRQGQSFSGAYSSPQMGQLHLTQQGEMLRGTYNDARCGCQVSGTLHGTVSKNVAQFDFEETHHHCASTRLLRGRGYLFYRSMQLPQAWPELYGSRSFRVQAPTSQLRGIATIGVPAVVTARGVAAAETDTSEHCP